MLLKVNEEGETIEVAERSSFKVFQRIYLSLQEDEIELANETFKKIYNDLIALYNQENFTIENYLQQLDNEYSQIVTTILMNEEKELLHNSFLSFFIGTI